MAQPPTQTRALVRRTAGCVATSRSKRVRAPGAKHILNPMLSVSFDRCMRGTLTARVPAPNIRRTQRRQHVLHISARARTQPQRGAEHKNVDTAVYAATATSVMRGAWCVVRGAWCVVRGAWCVARGAWCVVGDGTRGITYSIASVDAIERHWNHLERCVVKAVLEALARRGTFRPLPCSTFSPLAGGAGGAGAAVAAAVHR